MDSGSGAGAALSAIPVDVRVTVLLARFDAANREIQWRDVTRSLAIAIAMGVTGAAAGVGVWGLLASPVILLLGALWLHHDRRVGERAHYLKHHIEPELRKVDSVPGWEEFLDNLRVGRKRWTTFTSICARWTFPTLQLITIASGAGQYAQAGDFSPWRDRLVLTAVAMGLIIVVLTFSRVKHIRNR